MTSKELQALIGFDLSQPFGKQWGLHSFTVRCSQCTAVVINGVPTHKTGCPNEQYSKMVLT